MPRLSRNQPPPPMRLVHYEAPGAHGAYCGTKVVGWSTGHNPKLQGAAEMCSRVREEVTCPKCQQDRSTDMASLAEIYHVLLARD